MRRTLGLLVLGFGTVTGCGSEGSPNDHVPDGSAGSGGPGTGGASTGGQSSGGRGTGGNGTGGNGTGGKGTGGQSTGGQSSGGGAGAGGTSQSVDTDGDGVSDELDACPDGAKSTTKFGEGCECASGYLGDPATETCEDIDECSSENDCDEHARCSNTSGGYECTCAAEYVGDGKDCTFDAECALLVCAAEAHCEVTADMRTCACNDGYEGGGTTCSDVDECETNNGGCGSADRWSCENNPGAAPTCTDIDECETNNGGCGDSDRFDCENNLGAAPTCIDVNECDEALDDCDEHAACSNTEGSYECTCEPAYVGDGKKCTFDSSCSKLDCSADAHCEVFGQTRSCVCNVGYEGDGTTCTDIDECETNNGNCGSADRWLCANNDGAPPTCTDIDECETNNGGCGSAARWTCENREGDAPLCTDIDECETNNGGCGAPSSWFCTNNSGQAPTCTPMPQTTVRASISSDETQGGGASGNPAISRDGRFVAFTSTSVFAAADTNGLTDVYLRDLVLGTTELISRATDGAVGNRVSNSGISVSADGRYVAFASEANNLAGVDGTPFAYDIFVRDRLMGTTERISVNSDEAPANGDSRHPVISADGRYVVFHSQAINLAPGDTNTIRDLYVRDRELGTTTLVSVSSGGVNGNGDSWKPAISDDGRLVAFTSAATNLVPALPADTNNFDDIFLRDLALGTTTLLSVSSTGVQGNGGGQWPSMSADGRYVVFYSASNNLVPNDTNGGYEVFLRDLTQGTTVRVNVPSAGGEATAGSFSEQPMISSDGRYVVFRSNATNLVPGDTNNLTDIFVRDLVAGTTERVSVGDNGQALGGLSGGVSGGGLDVSAISGDGRAIAFASLATNLVLGDTNNVQDVFVRLRP